MRRLLAVGVSFGFLLSLVVGEATSQDAAKSAGQAKKKSRLRGSLIEDRAAKKLVEAGDARLEAQELKKAVEVWQSVIEPVSYTHLTLPTLYSV